jgi:hypothetical protein
MNMPGIAEIIACPRPKEVSSQGALPLFQSEYNDIYDQELGIQGAVWVHFAALLIRDNEGAT